MTNYFTLFGRSIVLDDEHFKMMIDAVREDYAIIFRTDCIKYREAIITGKKKEEEVSVYT